MPIRLTFWVGSILSSGIDASVAAFGPILRSGEDGFASH
jgi:hypothetical protein